MIRHVVSWKLLAEDPADKAEQVALISTTLLALVPVIPQVHSMTLGTNIVDAPGNWDLVLVADYLDLAGMKVYQDHPGHVAALGVIKALVAQRSAVDFEF